MSEQIKTEDLFSISSKIKQLMELGIEKINALPKDNDSSGDYELRKYLDELTKQVDRIKLNFVKGLGQMYEGVLVSNEISIRKDGRIYRYRCHYPTRIEHVAQNLFNNKDEVIRNLGADKGAIVFELLSRIFKIEIKDRYGNALTNLDVNFDVAVGSIDINPIEVFDFDEKNRYSDNSGLDLKGRMLILSKIKYDKGYVTFQDNNDNSLKNDSVKQLLLEKYKTDILFIRDKIINILQIRKNELIEIEKAIEDKMGKYLLIAELGTAEANNGR